MMYYNDFFFPYHIFGPIFMFLFWALIIYGAVYLFRQGSHAGPHARSHGGESGRALEILKERYAKGEITKEQFESMKKDIQ